MKLLRSIVILTCLALLVAAAAFWWNLPTKVDMSSYAPADSLVYLEINSFSDITTAIQQTDAWKVVSPAIGLDSKPVGRWSQLTSRAGIGPVEAVLTARAQIALVVLGVDTTEKDDLLRIKPEVAIIVETHTSKWRMKNAAVDGVRRLAGFAYGDATCTERTAEADYVECVESKGKRQIVAGIQGSVVVVGNSLKAVESCLQVRRGQRPGLHTDSEFTSTRESLKGEASLAFGYVSHRNTAKLFSLAAPLLLGKAPGDGKLEQHLADSAGKILGSIAWTSTVSSGGIEDRYHISLDSDVVKRLEPAFDTPKTADDFWKLVPDSFRSLTVYRSQKPQAAWTALDTAVALKLDAVSSVIFASLLRSGLSGYGVDDPKQLLAGLSPPLLTLRPTLGEGSLLLARVGKGDELKQALVKELLPEGKGQILEGLDAEPNGEKEFSALLLDGFVVIGKTDHIKVYLAQLRNHEVVTAERLQTVRLETRSDRAAVITFTNERPGLTAFVRTLMQLKGRTLSDQELEDIQKRLQSVRLSSTESRLSQTGIERITQSAFGQFGSLISFAQSDSSNSLSQQ